jgi:metallo-beta-lactamase class B
LKALAALILAALSASASAGAPEWSAPHQPFAIFGNTYYVGTDGISAVLITSPQGHILIDGATPEGGKVIAENIRTLGFKMKDVKYILNSHAHYDHSGGIAGLQKLSGAKVLTGAAGARALSSGKTATDDPQFGSIDDFPAVANAHAVKEGEIIKLGPLAVTAHLTPGHTPGGASWTWKACEKGQCKEFVFADSLTAVSADNYKFTAHPQIVASLESSIAKIEVLPCDVLITAHPGVVDLFERQARAAKEGVAAYGDGGACRTLGATSRTGLAKRLESERQ